MEQVQEVSAAETAEALPGIPEPLVIGRTPRLLSQPGPLPSVRRPDTEIDGCALPGLEVRAASVRGDAHRYYGTPRQDAMGLWHDGDRRLVACVADGLGSKDLSHVGASAACEVAHTSLPDFLVCDEPVTGARRLIENVAGTIGGRADSLRVAPGELSTTFLAAVVEEVPERSVHRAVIMRVGDCTAWRLHGGVWVSCFQDDEPEAAVASSATAALPRDVAEVEVAHADLYPGDMLLLCTDGVARPMSAPQVSTQLSDWWRAGPPSLPEFFWQMSFRARTHDDDRTAVCIWRV